MRSVRTANWKNWVRLLKLETVKYYDMPGSSHANLVAAFPSLVNSHTGQKLQAVQQTAGEMSWQRSPPPPSPVHLPFHATTPPSPAQDPRFWPLKKARFSKLYCDMDIRNMEDPWETKLVLKKRGPRKFTPDLLHLLLKGSCHEIIFTRFFSSITSFLSYKRHSMEILNFGEFSLCYSTKKKTRRCTTVSLDSLV